MRSLPVAWLWLCLCLAGLGLATGPGHGGGVAVAAPRATAAETGRAKAKLQAGARALEEGEYEEALARFQEAFQIVPSPKIHFNFGLAYKGLARHAEARESFERFIAETGTVKIMVGPNAANLPLSDSVPVN